MDLLKLYIHAYTHYQFLNFSCTVVQSWSEDNDPLQHVSADQGCFCLFDHCSDLEAAYSQRPFSLSMSEIPECLQQSQFSHSVLLWEKSKPLEWDNKENAERNKHNAYLTACSQLWCRFHLWENAKQIITQWDFCSHQSLCQTLNLSFLFPFSFISFHLYLILHTHITLNCLEVLLSFCQE